VVLAVRACVTGKPSRPKTAVVEWSPELDGVIKRLSIDVSRDGRRAPNVLSHAPNGKVAEVARMLKAIHAQESRKSAQAKATEVVAGLKEMKLRTAAELVEQKVVETLTYYAFPSTHWRQITTNNPLETGKNHSGDQTTHPRGRSPSRWEICIDAGCGETQAHRLDQVGQPALPGDGGVVEPGEAGSGSLKESDRAIASSRKSETIVAASPIGDPINYTVVVCQDPFEGKGLLSLASQTNSSESRSCNQFFALLGLGASERLEYPLHAFPSEA
jgi:Transposase, Mutator family